MSKASQIDPNSLVDPKFLGIPYKLGGKGFDGADCIGMAILWLKELGIDYEYDDRQGPILAHWWEHDPRRFVDAMLQLGSMVRFTELRKYDVVLLIGPEQSFFPSCLGIMVDDRHFLTSMENRGSFVEMLNLDWKEKFWGGLRLHKTAEKFQRMEE